MKQFLNLHSVYVLYSLLAVACSLVRIDSITRGAQPGYPAIGRLKGLAELRGVMTAVSSLRNLPL